MAQRKELLKEQTELWQMYEEGIDYQNSLGLRAAIPKHVDFYEGKQWPSPTESTKNLPRPVVNIVKMICRSKKSSIMSVPVKLIYKSYSPGTDLERFNSFAESVQREIGQNRIDREAIDDAVKKGSFFYHYYWDKNAVSISGKLEGSVRCELIDPLNIFFSNPSKTNEQEQSWILISSRKDLNEIAELCDSDVRVEELKTDEGEMTGTNNREASQKATLLTRYFRKDGEIWCERGTKTLTVNRPFKLCPDYSYVDNLLSTLKNEPNSNENREETQNSAENSTHIATKFLNKARRGATLFPIVCGYYERREGSIYGISEIEGLIPNQKAINFNIAMSLLNAQQCAWGKYIALPNALKGQKISNTPGQVLIDHSGTGEGIKRMHEEAVSDAPIALTEALTELTKTFTGANEIIAADKISTNMSGVAIAQLQAQNEVSLEDLRFNFWEAKRKQGLVLAQFFRLYYFNREYIKKTVDKDGHECEICDIFSSKEYENSIFDVTVEPVGGTRASIASDISMLDNCLRNGKISLETYIKSYPDSAINNKQEILRQIEAEKSSETELLRKELQRYKKSKTGDPVSVI